MNETKRTDYHREYYHKNRQRILAYRKARNERINAQLAAYRELLKQTTDPAAETGEGEA